MIAENNLCRNCNYEHICSDERKERHKKDCNFSEKIEGHMFYPGGSPPRKFCPICVHKEEKCISSLDLELLSKKWNLPLEQVKEEVLTKQGYVLTEYDIIETSTMISCNRFKEID